MKLYHVTPSVNTSGILDTGIDPSKSRGKRKVSWFVGHSQLMWAIAHVSDRHRVPANEITVFSVFLDKGDIKKTAWYEIYTCNTLQEIDGVMTGKEAIDQHARFSEYLGDPL